MDILKTWPAVVPPKTVAQIFSPTASPFARYYFTIGRGKPRWNFERMWFTYQGRILGWFIVEDLVRNDGSLPRLSRLDGAPSEWQIRKDAWVAVCAPPCVRIKERVFHDSFRGWRYFNFDEYRGTGEARHRL